MAEKRTKKARKPLTPGQKHWLAQIGAYLASVGVPIGTCAIVFPVEIVEETRLSVGATLIITAIISISVFRNKLKSMFENYTLIMAWAIILLISIIADQFIYELKIISLVGLAANVGAMPLFKIAENQGEIAAELKKRQREAAIATAAQAKMGEYEQ